MSTHTGTGVSTAKGGGGSGSRYCTPRNLTLEAITGGVRLTWTKDDRCTTLDGFEIWVSDNGAEFSLLATVSSTTLTYDDSTSYIAGHVISYKVRSGYTWTYSDFSAPSTQIVDTSYSNTGGTGNRTSIITVSISASTMAGAGAANVLVDGTKSGATNKYFSPPASCTGKYIKFDFGIGASKVITEAKYYQQTTASQGTWKWQGSNNDNDWTDLGSNFTLGGVATQTITTLSGNASGYRYYRILGVTGNPSEAPYVYEFEFKISA